MKTINDREQQQKSAIPAATGDRRMDRSIEGGILLAITTRQNVLNRMFEQNSYFL
jgi:hypothetical protein